MVNCSNVRIRDCFIRTDDDCISPKGKGPNDVPIQNLVVSHCVLWTDRANIWRIGYETDAAATRNFVFRDIDVLQVLRADSPGIAVGEHTRNVIFRGPGVGCGR